MIFNNDSYLFNNILIAVYGECRERFINLCRNKGIYLTDIKLKDGYITCIIKREQFVQLRQVCRITGCRIRIVKKYGYKYLAFKYRKHYSFLIGILLAFIIIKWINMYVWDISYEGNNIYSEQYISSYLGSIGIETGMRISSVDCEWLEHRIREDFSEVTWASVSNHGTRIVIAIKENDGAAEIQNEYKYGDMYADIDGVIESIIIRQGTPVVKAGDNVSSGQLLVSGSVVIYDAYGAEMEMLNVPVDADIYIRTSVQYDDIIYRDYKDKEYTGKSRTEYILDMYGKEITLLKPRLSDNWDCFAEEINIKLFDKISLPVRLNRLVYNEYQISDKIYSDEQMEQILNERFDLYIKNLQNSVQILDNDVKIIKEDGYYEMAGVIHVISPSVRYGTDGGNED